MRWYAFRMEHSFEASINNPKHHTPSSESFGTKVDLNNPRLQLELATLAFPTAESPREAFRFWMEKKQEDGATLAEHYRGLRETDPHFEVDMEKEEEMDAVLERTRQSPPLFLH